MSNRFFSDSWCAEAIEAEHAASDEIYKRFKTPADFSHVIALEVTDRPGLVTHLQYVQGRCTAWTTVLFDEEDVWARFTAPLESWQKAAEGEAKASNLVMAGRMKLIKGAMKDALDNAPPFDRLVRCFSDIPTDWDV